MASEGVEKNNWKVQPDTTIQVVQPPGLKSRSEEERLLMTNWRSLFISLGFIFLVAILVAVAAILLLPFQQLPFHGSRLTLEHLEDNTLTADHLGAQWLSDIEYAFLSEHNGLILKNMETHEEKTLIGRFTLEQIRAEEFSVSSNRQFVLLAHDIQKERLFKRTAKFSIYDLYEHHYNPLKLFGDEVEHLRYQHVQWVKLLRNETSQNKREDAQWSEDGTDLVIVFKNNIYYMKRPIGPVLQITRDGTPHEIFNGIPDLMNEEIMGSSACVWPNLDGDRLAYVSFNNKRVLPVPVIEYDTEGRPSVLPLKYPTVTSPLPEVSVWVVNISPETSITHRWRLESTLYRQREEYFVIAVGWIHNSKLWVSEMSRDQGTTHLMSCEGPSWHCETVFVNHVTGGISPAIRSVVWFGSKAAFPWPIRTDNGWWYNHVALVGNKSRKRPTLDLHGYHVREVLTSDTLQEKIYFLGSDLSKGIETQHLYSVSPRENSLECCSCVLGCPHVEVKLNPLLTHAIVSCVGSYLTTMHLINLQNLNVSAHLHTQPVLREEIRNLALPITLYKEVSLDPNIHASLSLSLPPDWKRGDDSCFYPLVLHLIGVENYDQTAVERHLGLPDLLASHYFTAHARIVLWESDSYYHNDSILTKSLQMAQVIRSFLDNHKFLDPSHISIWGWASGASMALKMLELDALDVKCVMALNPVMDWKQYGTYWSERLLGALDSQSAGRRYEDSKVLAALDTLKETKIMLMQSTKDILSHHSSGIARYLISRGIYFQHIVYPESTVFLRRDRIHVIKSFERFITDQQCITNFNY